MLNILIVEDVQLTRDFLQQYLANEYAGARIDAAGTVAEATAVLAAAQDAKIRYKVAILDFKLPARGGENPEIDVNLRRAVLAATSPDAVVFHITAFPDDPAIVRFLKDQARDDPLRRRRSGVPAVFSKLDGNWAGKLYDVIRRVVHGDRIRAALDDLYPPPGGRPPACGPRPAQHLTHALAALLGDIEQHWQWLDDGLRDRIHFLFRIDDRDGGQVAVSPF